MDLVPAASPAKRAIPTIGSRPPRLMSKLPRCSPECSTTMSWRKPVGGLLASASLSRRRSIRVRFLASPHGGEHAERLARPDGSCDRRAESRSPSGSCRSARSSHLPIASRHSPAGQAIAEPDAVTPWVSRLQARRREQVIDLFGDTVHVRRSGIAPPVIPDHPRVDVGGRHGLPPAVAAKREPRELGRRRPGRLDGELDRPPRSATRRPRR